MVASVLFGAGLVFAHQGVTGVVKTRMDGFKQSQQDFKSLIKAAHHNDYDRAWTLSLALEEWGLAMPGYFPEGSQQPPSEAADTIWSDAEGFNAAIDNYVRSVRAINAAALAKDKSAIMAAIKKTSDSCSSCHNAFRVK